MRPMSGHVKTQSRLARSVILGSGCGVADSVISSNSLLRRENGTNDGQSFGPISGLSVARRRTSFILRKLTKGCSVQGNGGEDMFM